MADDETAAPSSRRGGRAPPPSRRPRRRPSPPRCSRCATVEPTRPQPITIAFTTSLAQELLLEDALRVGEHHHLAGRAAEHVVDGRAEEARLAPPARRRAHHDQVGADLASPSRRSPRRSRARGRCRPRSSRRARAPASRAPRATRSPAPPASAISASSGSDERDADHVQRVDRAPALLGELDRGRQHLLADRPELDRDEDPLVLALAGGNEVRASAPRRARAARRRGGRARRRRGTAPRSEPGGTADPRRGVRGERDDPERDRRAGSRPARRPEPADRGSGRSAGRRYGRGRSGSVKRRRTTAACAIAKVISTPKL